MKTTRRLLKLFCCLGLAYSALIFNPFWPTWGMIHDHFVDGHYISYTATNLSAFLRDECFSSFQHVSAILSLIFLYVGIILVLIAIATSSKKKVSFVFSILAASLLLAVTCLLPFSHDISIPFLWLNYMIPALAGGLLIASNFVGEKSNS
ncbi:MAG: hypothetical protein II158_06170 [Bacilli bacterium]|nr:hypothetical protein [Bacilli bacterium]